MKKINIEKSDRTKILNFIELISQIRQRPFIQEFSKNSPSNFIYNQSDSQAPNEELLRSFLLDVRKLYMEREPTSFKKMVPIFMKYVELDEKIELQKFQNEYEENLNIQFPAGLPVKESKTIKEILDDWLYGHYFHEDEDKKIMISNLGYAREFYRWIFIDNIGGIVFECAYQLEDLCKKLLYRDSIAK